VERFFERLFDRQQKKRKKRKNLLFISCCLPMATAKAAGSAKGAMHSEGYLFCKKKFQNLLFVQQ